MYRNKYLIEADELIEKLSDENLQIFDADVLFFGAASGETAHEHYLQAHITGAAFMDQMKLSDPNSPYMFTLLPAEELITQIGKLGISPDSEVVLYSPTFLPAVTRAWWVLRYLGHDNVRVLNGGLAAWQQSGGEVEKTAHEYDPTRYTGQVKPGMFASKEEVLAAMENGETVTVNTLMQISYDAAHITGSVLSSCMALMDEEMTFFLADEQITESLKDVAQFKRIITYCGGGFAATVNGIAHMMMGYDNVSVYDGSMDEWEGEGLPLTTSGEGKWAVWEE